MKKRCLSVLLSLVLLTGIGSALSPILADGLSPAEVEARFASAESIWADGGVYVDNWDDGCSTCYGFVRELFRHLFGTELPTMWSTSDARFSNHPEAAVEVAHLDYYTVEQLSAVLAQTQPGDVLIATTGGGNHGVIIRSAAADGSGVYVYDANWHKNSAGQPLIRTNAWWSAEDIKRARPAAVTIYRDPGQTGSAGYYSDAPSAVYPLDQPALAPGAAAIPGEASVPTGSAIIPGSTVVGPTDSTVVSTGAAGTVSGLAAPGEIYSDRHVYGTAETIRFSWGKVNGATGYSVTLRKDNKEIFSTNLGISNSFTSTPLSAGEYELEVRSVSGQSVGTAAAGFSFTVTDAAPAAVKGFASNKTTYSVEESIVLTWNDAYGAERIRLYLDRDDGNLYYLDTDSQPLTLPALEEGIYTLRLRAINHAGYTDSDSIRIAVGKTLPAQQGYYLMPMPVLLQDEKEDASGTRQTVIPISIPQMEGATAVPEEAAEESAAEEDEGIHFQRTLQYARGHFRDVEANSWYSDSVIDAYELGLMQGSGYGSFDPNGKVTLIQAIVIADRIHTVYYQGTGNPGNPVGKEWYQSYLGYALANGIIDASFSLNNVGSVAATREQFADILSRALPPEALTVINDIADGQIPDVSMDSPYAAGIYALYRAGILTGGENGEFSPQSTITRAEAAAIVSRMVESDNRITFQLDE